MYHYEVLGHERFQEFCQSLIVDEYPNAQCLPVGQPDGGRDAFLHRYLVGNRHGSHPATEELVVFQVKYVKSVGGNRDERKMIEEIIKLEAKKVERLKAAGLTKYILITNVKGTSHFESGSIDQVNKQLSTALGIESYCWWRDDLDRRLDKNSSIKWSYPEILKATDLLEALVSNHLGEDEERRRGAIRAYMTAQYEDDQELKFKQTDLRSTMTELFVDLPMRLTIEVIDPEIFRTNRNQWRVERVRNFKSYAYHIDMGSESNRSAEFFIRSESQGKLSRIVLEGAPGQGKSTITQYVCQVMRMQFLNKRQELAKLPEIYKKSRLKIPFRVDLRDMAKWMAGIDPFSSKGVELEEKKHRSLEGFLAGQVRHVSGGHDFSVSDLTAVARASHLFLALDGFDEVADIELRKKLVEEITKGSNRLMNAGGYSVQTVVTSRPAAFAKSIRFPRDQWAYYELLPLEQAQVDAYSKKWMKAKGIKESEQIQLTRTLAEKLKEAHTQFLAKNPMQLTILLSLIHNRGASLPEKRTAMYDAYMDMFFSRESEKADIVRDNRDLLIDIHRFLAWQLQTSAEAGENGSIERGALRALLLVYLDSQGEDVSIVGALFNGIIERVGALVSRVQETYEFEVQPLREYFAARHLYETAPYSPAGDEKAGTKLERFDALVRNPYWLNVARFYGGCFSKGEVSALVDELVQLSESEPYKQTGHPRSLALMLLSDWVFTQYQPAVKKVVHFIGERPYVRQLLAATERSGASVWSALPDRSGRSELVSLLWRFLLDSRYADERSALAEAILQNSPLDERVTAWKQAQSSMDETAWLQAGMRMQLLQNPSAVVEVFRQTPSIEAIQWLITARQFDFLESDNTKDIAEKLLRTQMRSVVMRDERKKPLGRLEVIALMLSYYQYTLIFSDESSVPISIMIERRMGSHRTLKGAYKLKHTSEKFSQAERDAIRAYDCFLDTSAMTAATSLVPWIDLVEAMRKAWGDCEAIDRVAFLAAGARSSGENGIDMPLASTTCLVSTARFIRLKSGAPRWWEDRLAKAGDVRERKRLTLLLWMWGTPKTIIKVSATLATILRAFSEEEWTELHREFSSFMARRRTDNNSDLHFTEMAAIVNLGPRVLTFLGGRVSHKDRVMFSQAIVRTAEIKGSAEIQFAMDTFINEIRMSNDWQTVLPQIQFLYQRGASVRRPLQNDEPNLNDATAKLISEQLSDFPLPLVSIADGWLRSAAGAAAPKLLDVAQQQKWFALADPK